MKLLLMGSTVAAKSIKNGTFENVVLQLHKLKVTDSVITQLSREESQFYPHLCTTDVLKELHHVPI